MGEFSTAAALKTPTRNGYNAQGVNLIFRKLVLPKIHYLLPSADRVAPKNRDIEIDMDVYRYSYMCAGVALALASQS